MTERLADLRLVDSHMRTTQARKEVLSAYLVRLGRTFGFGSADFVSGAVDAVLAAQTQQALATWEMLTTAARIADPLGRDLDIGELPLDVLIGSATHAGTPLETVYRRPGLVAEELAAALGAEVAQSRAERTVVELVDSDVSVAARNTEYVHGKTDLRVVGYRRVPNAGACSWCRYIATQRYTIGTLAPAHTSCGCGTREIFGRRDPGQILLKDELARIKEEGVPIKYGQRQRIAQEANAALADE
jgi:hypothetical protein